MGKFTDKYRGQVSSFADLARELGLTRQAVYQWQRVPAEIVPKVEKATGIPRSELRPDLWEKP